MNGDTLHRVTNEGTRTLWGTLNLSQLANHRLSERERIALTDALTGAWESRDPVRWILVRVRAELLGLTARKYAPEIGLEPHSLVTKEQKGGTQIAPSTYSNFLQDWEERSRAHNQNSATFRRAATLLLHHLLRKDYLGFAGLLTRWQCRLGAQEFTRRTDIDPKALSGYRKNGFIPHFSDLITIARQAQLIPSAQSAALWSHPTVLEARREFLHYSLKRGRSPATTLLRCALELSGNRLKDASLKAQHPSFTAEERLSLLRYDPLPPALFSTLLSSTSLSEYDRQRLVKIHNREQSSRLKKPRASPAAVLLEKRMRALGLDTASVRALFSIDRTLGRREELGHLRRGMKGVDETSTVFPFGIVAWVLAESRPELKKMLSLRREEIRSSYRRRVGTELSDLSTERKVWGLSENELKGAGGDFRKATLQKLLSLGVPAKQELLRRTTVAPQTFVAKALSSLPHNSLAHAAESSAATLHRIASGTTYPTIALFRRIVLASRVPFVPSLNVLWHDGYAAQYRAPGTKSNFGAMQCRILDSLIASKGESQHALFLQHCTVPEAQRAERALVKLRRSLDIPLTLFHELLGYFGIERESAHWHAIASMLSAKNAADAIASWFLSDMPGAEAHLRQAGQSILKVSTTSIQNLITTLPTDPHELMQLSEQISNHTSSQLSSERDAIIADTLHLLTLFPGASIADLEAARSKLNTNPQLDAAVKFAWSRVGKIPTKEGALFIEPTTSTGEKISRSTAAQIASSIRCPTELSSLLFGNSFVLLNKLSVAPVSDPWSGAILKTDRGMNPDDIRLVSEALLPKLLPALSLQDNVADNLLRWLTTLWNNGASAQSVVDAIRRHEQVVKQGGGSLPKPSETPMGIIDAALIAACAHRKQIRP